MMTLQAHHERSDPQRQKRSEREDQRNEPRAAKCERQPEQSGQDNVQTCRVQADPLRQRAFAYCGCAKLA